MVRNAVSGRVFFICLVFLPITSRCCSTVRLIPFLNVLRSFFSLWGKAYNCPRSFLASSSLATYSSMSYYCIRLENNYNGHRSSNSFLVLPLAVCRIIGTVDSRTNHGWHLEKL